MRSPYLPYRVRTPLLALGGSQIHFRPVLPVLLCGPTGSQSVDGLLDTGSDETVFPDRFAPHVGIDLSKGMPRSVMLAGRPQPVVARYFSVTLRISDGISETYKWSAVVGFVPVPLRHALLGHASFLQFFDIEFRGADREVVLTTNRTFSGCRI